MDYSGKVSQGSSKSSQLLKEVTDMVWQKGEKKAKKTPGHNDKESRSSTG